MQTVLKVENLNKYFGKRQVIKNLSFETFEGEVFGFLGPNGAGKTTTIKIIVGLLTMDSGSISVNNSDLNKNFEKALSNIGAIVENPEMYKHLSGVQNLKQYANMRKGITEKRIQEVIELVGLKNRINEKVRKYSLGMRQRLGVAQALLHKPKLLILDEPTNGLDPAGIKELRDILKNLAHKEKIGVMVSSHLMSEMELMCDRVGIIVNGELLKVETIEELIIENSDSKQIYKIGVNDISSAINTLNYIDKENIKRINERYIEVSLDSADYEKEIIFINEQLVKAGVGVFELSKRENKKLEDVFIEMTKSGGAQIV